MIKNLKSFSEGRWVLERPTLAGSYFVAGRNTDPGLEIIHIYIDPKTGCSTPTKSWGGWWWSTPIFEMPETPDQSFSGEPVPEVPEGTYDTRYQLLMQRMDECIDAIGNLDDSVMRLENEVANQRDRLYAYTKDPEVYTLTKDPV